MDILNYRGGKRLYLDKKYKEALDNFSQIELKNVGNFDESIIHHYKALCLAHLGKFNQSFEEFALALKFRPNYAKIQFDMGLTYYFNYSPFRLKIMDKLFNNKNLSKALECFENGLLIEPNNADCWYYRGFVLELLGRKDEARKSYIKSKKHHKNIENYEKSLIFEKLRE